MLVTTNSYAETLQLGKEIASKLGSSDFVALYGNLGAGKTALVTGIISYFDSTAHVSSPTYSIVNEYLTAGTSIYHFDFYRINDADALYSTGYYDYIGQGIIISEWSENIEYALPEHYTKITINNDKLNPDKRIFNIESI